jgi:transcriptional regulator with XRE-family HTH domain
MNIRTSSGGGRLVLVRRTQFVDRRKTIGLNQDQLAERMRVDRSTIGRWERGETTPQPWKRQTLANALRVSLEELDELLTQADPTPPTISSESAANASASGGFEMAPIGNNGTDAPVGVGTVVPSQASGSVEPRPEPLPTDNERPAWTAPGTHSSAALAAQSLWETGYDSFEDLMIRRTFLLNAAALAGIGAADKLPGMEAIRHGLNRSVAEERAEADADEWRQIALDYGESYRVAAPTELLGPLMTDMLGLQAALRRYASNPVVQRDLLSTAALLSAFTAQTISNMSQPLEAGRWWRTAKNAADRSGDPYSIIWVRGREICHAMGSRPDPVVLRLIEAADSITAKAPSAAALELTANKAQVFAYCGREQDALAAIGQVRKQFEQSPTGYSGSMLDWGEESLHCTESFAYSRLGRVTDAERATHDGLSLYAANGERGLRHPAGLRLNLAFTLVRSGDLPEGLHLAQSVINSLPEGLRGTKFEDGRKLLTMVPPARQRSADVQEYREWLYSIEQPTPSV